MGRLAVILVAGGGTRLRPLTDHCPKALLDLGGETMLARAMRLLRARGVERFVLATGFCDAAVQEATRGADVVYCKNEIWSSTQNIVSLERCAEAIGTEGFFQLDGDVVFDPAILARLEASDASIAVAVDRRAGLGDEEMKVLAKDTRITKFGKDLDPKAAAGEAIGIAWIASPIAARYLRLVREAVSARRTNIYYEAIFDDLVGQGADVRLVDVTGLPWAEVDTKEDLAVAMDLVRGFQNVP